MDSLVPPRTFLLNLKIHSKEEKKLKRLLQSIQGVHTVTINAKQGNVTISGTIDPSTIIMMLEKYGKKAELLWEQRPAKDGDDIQLITSKSQVVDQLDDPKMVEQLQQLSGIKNLKKVEVTYSRTLRLSFNGHKDKKSMEDEDMEVITPKETPCRACAASASCCGGHGLHNFHGHHGCCQMNASWPPPPAFGYMSPLEPAPSWPVNTTPSAPPLPSVYNPSPLQPPPAPPPPPPPPPQTYYNIFSDDNTTGCAIM